ELRQQTVGECGQIVSGLRQANAAPFSLPQRDSIAFLEPAHGVADGRLRHVQPVGCLRETAGPFDFPKNGKGLGIDHFMTIYHEYVKTIYYSSCKGVRRLTLV